MRNDEFQLAFTLQAVGNLHPRGTSGIGQRHALDGLFAAFPWNGAHRFAQFGNHLLGLYLPDDQHRGMRWRVPTFVIGAQSPAVNAVNVARCAQGKPLGIAAMPNLQSVKIVVLLIAAQLFDNHTALFSDAIAIERNSTEPIAQN